MGENNLLRYTASARLGTWDFIQTENRDEFLNSLARILQENAHAVLELASDQIEFPPPTNDPSLASVTAICDKIVARGNPTLVDLDFESTLLKGRCRPRLNTEELTEGPSVGFRLSARNVPGTTTDLLSAAEDLLFLPYRDSDEIVVPALPFELGNLTSEEEDIFLDRFRRELGSRFSAKLHRQVLIRDLVDCHDFGGHAAELEQSRVDFVFQVGDIKWVIEIDGVQHHEPGQRQQDERRDKLLRDSKWDIHRIPATEVRNGLDDRFERWKTTLLPAKYESVQEAIKKSETHAAALNSILIPHAVQRCLRGLLLLYSHEVLNSARKQRIVIIEEDLPVAAEAFRILQAIWMNIHVLAPDVPPAPELELDVIGGDPKLYSGKPEAVRYVDAPDGDYDKILSHSFLLDVGFSGDKERVHFQRVSPNLIRLRHAVGFRTERSLQWCEHVRYDLADVELAVMGQNDDKSQPIPQEKHEALLFFLRHIFRKRDFRDGQLRVIARLLQGKASIVLLPTGGGKSLTYQFSGLLLPGMTIIIDPLVALMNDQVDNLKATGIDLVDSVSSQNDPGIKEQILTKIGSGRAAFAFITPERLQDQTFRDRLRTVVAKFPVSLAVIDEAHCVSEWGHDFRPSYLHMPRNLQRYCSDAAGRKPTLVGLTGTASFAVLTDIQSEMQVQDEDAIILPRSFDRKELRFEVRKIPLLEKKTALKTLKEQLPRLLRANPQNFYNLNGEHTNSGIVFCPHVNGSLGVVDVASRLGYRKFFSGEKPRNFDGDEKKWNLNKKEVQRDFKRNGVQELVATKSFGMGIDKPNVRYTIHYVVPQSVEAFYQEAGRAGRNGKEGYALCSILYSDDNWNDALKILYEHDHQEALNKLESIGRNDQGDLLVQLWFMFNSYKGRDQDKELALDLWNRKLAPSIAGMSVGATKTKELSFRGNNHRKTEERAIFRLMLLGVVEDYTIDSRVSKFSIRVKNITPDDVKQHLHNYLMQYKLKDFADKKVAAVRQDTVEHALEDGIDVLIDFIYDEIVAKRKQALHTMCDLCNNFKEDKDFREAILNYLQESEFSDQLRGWRNRNFDEIGLESVHKLLGKITALDEMKRLVGTTRRMLDEDPTNLALRYLSTCARAKSQTESDSSTQQEAETLVGQIDGAREDMLDPDKVLLSILCVIEKHRLCLLDKVGDFIFRRAGTTAFARLVLGSPFAENKMFYGHSVKLLAAGALHVSEECAFYETSPKEI